MKGRTAVFASSVILMPLLACAEPKERPDRRVLVASIPIAELDVVRELFAAALSAKVARNEQWSVNQDGKVRKPETSQPQRRNVELPALQWRTYQAQSDPAMRFALCVVPVPALESAGIACKPSDVRAIAAKINHPDLRVELSNHLPNLLKQWQLVRAPRGPGEYAPAFEF